jgi:uncharacterized protein (TIGR03437 family)
VVLNSASLLPGNGEFPGQVGTGELITLTGYGIGPEQGVGYRPDNQGHVPTQLAGVRVLFDGIPALVFYAQSRQVNTQVPFEISGNQFTTLTLEYNSSTIGSITLPLGSRSPAVFRLQPNVSAQALAVNQDGSFNGPRSPAAPGSVVSFWGNGYGPIDASCPTGTLNPDSAVSLQNGYATFGYPGQPGIPAQYTGSAPTYPCGIVQINFLIPPATPSGTLTVAFLLNIAVPTSPTGRATDGYATSTISVK